MSQYDIVDMDIQGDSSQSNNPVFIHTSSQVSSVQQPEGSTNIVDIQPIVVDEVSIPSTGIIASTSTSTAMDQTDGTTTDTDVAITHVYTIPSGRSVVGQATKPTLVQTGVNIVHLSPKPATVVQNSQDQFKEADKSKGLKLPKDEDDESECCPICLEPWSNSGGHRLSSLNCGHLFGRSCIERWLRSKGRDKCPQCNAPARRHQIRNIYAKVIKAIDTSERDATVKELEKERKARKAAEKARKDAEEAKADAQIKLQIAQAECEKIKSDLKKQKEMFDEINYSSQSRKYVFEKHLQVAQSGARVMAYDPHSCTLVVSKPSPNTYMPGYGVVKVSSLDMKPSQYIPIHSKPIRDAVFSNQNNGLLLTAGMDKILKITSIKTNSEVLSYPTPTAVWSCAWNTSDVNYIFAGLQNGECYMFDIRQTNTHVDVMKNREGVGSCPMVSVAFIPKDVSSELKPCGVLTCSLEEGRFWEKYNDSKFVLNKLLSFPTGSCTCLRFEPKTRNFLLSLRPSKECNKSRHITYQLKGIGTHGHNYFTEEELTQLNRDDEPNLECQTIAHFYGGASQKCLSRSAVFTCPDINSRLFCCAGDEASNTVLLWDGLTGKKLQEFPSQGTVMDICSFQANNTGFLATLTEQTLSFYKWK